MAQGISQPLGAFGHFLGMMLSRQEAVRTRHGQRFITLMEGDSFNAIFAAFERHPDGKALLDALPDTDGVLGDRIDLSRRPIGSVGKSYLDFLVANGFDPAAYSEIAKEASIGFSTDRKRTWLRNRIDAIHDVRHVLTAYGPELLGEACLLAFRIGQVRHPGAAILAAVAGIGCIFLYGPIGTFKALTEAYRRGRAAVFVDLYPIELDLSDPLESCRAKLRLAPPRAYQALLDRHPNRGLRKRAPDDPAARELSA